MCRTIIKNGMIVNEGSHFVGSVIISAPLGIFIIVNGSFWHGMLLILCGILVIANADNLVRIFLNKWMTDTHPLIVIFGVFMGIPLFGFWGIIFGPLLISIFLLLVKIYYREFRLMSPEDMAAEDAESRDARRNGRKAKAWGRIGHHAHRKAQPSGDGSGKR